ncbi:MAG: hypothetical protein FWH27_02050 [Planctomycetaceae bacterium]|nr:hypothetical protein [Planctomycetaceae bacterium]
MTKSTLTLLSIAMILAMTLLAGSGCSSWSGKMSLPTWGGTSSPTQIVAIWDPVIRHEGDKVLRGFAARVMFYDNAAGKKALRVRGNFDVYAYDEDDPNKDGVTPTRIIRFQVDDLKNLESDSKMFGKSYTIWVPWDEAAHDSKKKNVSLIVRFKCDDGVMVMSHQVKISLPGMMNGEDEVEDPTYVNPYQEEKKQQMAKLEALAAKHRNNPNSLETEWKGTVPEHVVSREARPEMTLTRTFNVPGISRDGIAPAIRPEYSFASATDEQKYLAQLMIANAQMANAQNAQNQQVSPAANNLAMQNPQINQVQFQALGDNVPPYQQPMFQPAQQPMFQSVPTYIAGSGSYAQSGQVPDYFAPAGGNMPISTASTATAPRY